LLERSTQEVNREEDLIEKESILEGLVVEYKEIEAEKKTV